MLHCWQLMLHLHLWQSHPYMQRFSRPKFWHLQQLLRCLHVPMQCPNFNSLRAVSFSAAVMSLSYSTIAIGGAIAIGKQPDAYYNLDRFSTADKVRPAHTLLHLSVVKVPSWAACSCLLEPGYIGVKHHSWRDCGALTGVIEERAVLQVFNIFNALGTIAFAYGGHNVVCLLCSRSHFESIKMSSRPGLFPAAAEPWI